jgi:hypothetical protein
LAKFRFSVFWQLCSSWRSDVLPQRHGLLLARTPMPWRATAAHTHLAAVRYSECTSKTNIWFKFLASTASDGCRRLRISSALSLCQFGELEDVDVEVIRFNFSVLPKQPCVHNFLVFNFFNFFQVL